MGKDQDLLEAARKGNFAIVEKILGQRAKRSGPLASLRRGPGANVQDSSGYSALHHSALNGHKEIVKLLLEHDASPNIVDGKGSSPLHLAAWSGNLDIVRFLLNGHQHCHVNLTTKDDETALHCAAQYGHTAVVTLLLAKGCDPGIRNCRGETALELAAQYGRLDTVELLVRDPSLIQCLKMAAPDTVYPHTPLHLASRNGHKSVVEVLLKADFSVNMRTKAGTALHESALCGKVDVVRTLLKHNVDTSIRNSENYTVMDLLSQFNTAQASQEIMGILKRHKRGLTIIDSDGESISHPFPTMTATDSDIGSPYENVRPCSKNARSHTTDPSPGTSPQRWDYQRHVRPPEALDDRRNLGLSGMSITKPRSVNKITSMLGIQRNTKPYKSLPTKRPKPASFDGITFSFSEQLSLRKISTVSSASSYHTAKSSPSVSTSSNSSRESDNSLYQMPCAPKQFMDSSVHSEDLNYLCTSRESDQISLSSTASSCGYPRRPDSGGTPLYIPMRGGQSPSSNNKVSPTPPKKPPRRNLSVSPTHLPPMSTSVDGVSNNAYEYLFLSHSGTRSQGSLSDADTSERRLQPGRSVDQYVEMNVYHIALDGEEPPAVGARRELQRGRSEELDSRSVARPLEPVAITSMYENVPVKQQNPRRKLRRHQDAYEEYDFRRPDATKVSASAPEARFVSSAFLMIGGDEGDFPMSPTHYRQPPTPDHPPPNALKAESVIYEKIRPLSQEYKRQSRDMETETEEEYLLIYDESSGSLSSSVSLSDRSVDHIIEEYNHKAPFAGLIRGSARVLENINSNTPAERPKTLKKLKRVYDAGAPKESSSSSEKESDNKENKTAANAALSPFDEQEEWAKIQEIMASFGTGLVRESVFVAELEKEFQSRLMTLSCSQGSLNAGGADSVEKWLQGLEMADYLGLFMAHGFDDITFLNGVLEEGDLVEMGVGSELDRQLILEAVKQLPAKINQNHVPASCNNNNEQQNSVRNWLARIHLDQYGDTFDRHLYHDMERIRRIWDVELSAVLDIDRIGHRKRILASVSSGEHIISGPKLEEINADLNLLKPIQNQEMKSPSTHSTSSSNTGTIRHRHKKSRPAPQPPKLSEKKKPAEMYVGGANSIKSQWRHQPILLITGVVQYSANYLGSTNILDFKGIESTKKSIQKISKAKDGHREQISFAVSYRGVKFINPNTKNTICEHEIRNINCACQDSDCQSYFAYITKDGDAFYCHVFEALNFEQATEVILTLGQAFELAYQMAVREQIKGNTKSGRDKPAVSPGSVSSHSRDFKECAKLNGHPLRMKPLTLSIAAEPTLSETRSTKGTPTKTMSLNN